MSDGKGSVTMRSTNGKKEIMVKDEGYGFSIEKVPDPLKEYKYKKSGRGIKLMQEVSEVSNNNKGNCLFCKL